MKNLNIQEKNGVTLLELIIVIAIMGIVISMVMSFNLFGVKTLVLSQKSADAQFEVRMAADFISKELRYADRVKIYSTKPALPTLNAHQLYIESGKLIFKKAGNPATIIGASDKNDFTFLVNKNVGSSDLVNFKVGKNSSTSYDLSTDVISLNLTNSEIEGDASGEYIEFFTDNADDVDPVSIISVANPPTQYVFLNGVVSMPLRVVATMNDTPPTTREVSVRWSPSSIDTTMAADHTITGYVVGFSGHPTFIIRVKDYTIVDIPTTTIYVNKGDVFNMPTVVAAECNDGPDTFIQNVEVTGWSPSSISTATAGTQTAVGTVSSYTTSPVELEVIVTDVTATPVANINETINQGVSYILPAYVNVTMSDGSIQLKSVTWSPTTIDSLSEGTKISNGTISGTSLTMTATIIVLKAMLPTPTAVVLSNGNNGSVRIGGTIGATAELRDNNGVVLGSGVIVSTSGSTGEVEILNVPTNKIVDVVLKKAGWLDSYPKVF